MTAPVIEKASDWLNLSDEQLAGMIGRPGAAEAIVEADQAVSEGRIAEPAQATETEAEPQVEAPKPKATSVPKASDAEAEPPAEPKGPPAPPPITKFALKDGQGVLDEAEASQNLRLDFKANGKDYADIPLDKVVKWAQMGVYNEEREQQVAAARQFVTEAQEQISEKDTQLAEYDQYTRRLLADPRYFAEAQKVYIAENSPEARARRAETELQSIQAQSATSAEDQAIASFVASDLTPSVVSLTQKNPEVRYEEIIGRFTMLTAPLLVRGRIPTQYLSEVRRLVEHELTPWVEEQNSDRSRTKTTQIKQVESAQTKTALAKRQIARRVAPPSASAPSQPKPKKYNTARDWLNDTLPLDNND